MKQLKRQGLIAALVLGAFWLTGCEKEPVEIVSVQLLTDMDRGSGNFSRVLEICLDHPVAIKSPYYHTLSVVSNEGYELKGGSWIRHMASDPKNPCQLRNLYLYLGKEDPPGSRQFIDEYLRPGNIKQLEIKLYAEEPVTGRETPMAAKIVYNL